LHFLKTGTANGNDQIQETLMSWSEEVDMAIELGLDQHAAMRICNIGRSHQLGLTREAYFQFVGKTSDEINAILDVIIVSAGKRRSASSGLVSAAEMVKFKR
jgi:hypothetical protein